MKHLATIKYHEESLRVMETEYAYSERIAIQILRANDELYATLSVNLPQSPLKRDEFFVKTWSENAEISDVIRCLDLFEDTGKRVSTGFVQAEVWKRR